MFERFATWVARASGRSVAFTLSVAIVFLWAATGPLFGYNDTWQLIINTATTVITFWMVFVLQHTQNKDTKAMELKLDELIRRVEGADVRLVGIEDASEEALDRMKQAETI
jgi:low affinity Fe/Cu permease